MPGAVIGTPRSFHNRFKFRVEFDGFTYSGWQKCSELSAELARIDHWEGGSIIANKSPGRMTIPDITLERGATTDMEMFTWFEECAKISAGLAASGLIDPAFRRNGAIIQLERDDSVVQGWDLFECYVGKFVAGEWDNTSDEKTMTSITIVPHYFSPRFR